MAYNNIAEIFHNSLERYPKQPALILSDKSWTYSELGRLVSSAISRLKDPLAGKGRRIAIIGNNHPAYIAAYLTSHYLGLATVEINRNESLAILLNIIKRTGACFVVTDREDLRKALQSHLPVESFEEFIFSCETGNRNNNEMPNINLSADGSEEASIVFTSGTTGPAKGVILSHANFCFISKSIADYLNLHRKDRYALILPLCHTYGKSVLLCSFYTGAAVVMLNGFNNIKNFLHQLSVSKSTILSAVPYHINILLKGRVLSDYDLSSLRVITSSANRLSHNAVENLLKALPWVQIFSMYGLTESTTRACFVPPDLLQKKKGSCGKPIQGMKIRIVGEDGSDAVTGDTGEILLSGLNIMKGYFSDPELTKETFVDGWLKTGDIGYLDNDGFLYLTGRKKDIIKCAGERISALEIEKVLLEHEGVEEAVVIGRHDSLMGEIIHAYVVPRTTYLKKHDLYKYCFKRLPHYKCPCHYIFIDKLPKNSMGKIKKQILIKYPNASNVVCE